MKEDKPLGENRYAPCKKCGTITKQTVILYNPADPNGGTVWYCTNCKENIEWESKAK
jgi:hypothetical protein